MMDDRRERPTLASLKGKVERAAQRGNVGPNLGAMSHAERDKELFGMTEQSTRELAVARALARSHGLGDHMGDEHLKPWLRDARTAIAALTPKGGDGLREALEEAREALLANIDASEVLARHYKIDLGNEVEDGSAYRKSKEALAKIDAALSATSVQPEVSEAVADIIQRRIGPAISRLAILRRFRHREALGAALTSGRRGERVTDWRV